MPIRDRIRQVKHLQNKYFICVLEEPCNLKNVATTLRNVSTFGVTKLYVIGCPREVRDFDALRENVTLNTLSVGVSRWTFVRRFETAAECLAHLRAERYMLAVTSSHAKEGEPADLYAGTFTHPRLAAWFGIESHGISDEALAAADLCIRVPMGGVVESPNLGTSTGIILSYISYQRLRYVFENGMARLRTRRWRRLR